MERAPGKSILSQSISEVLGTGETDVNAVARPGPIRKSLIYGSMALLVINPAQVNAVSLGEINVNSQLGHPLNATVPVTVAPGESMPKNCVVPTRSKDGIGAPADLNVSTPAVTQPGTYNLRVTTTNPLHEPMYEISLLIDCPGTPLLLRQYVLMLDLPGIPVSGTATPATVSVVSRGDTLAVAASGEKQAAQIGGSTDVSTVRTDTALRAGRSLQQSGDLIPNGTTYRIRKGDTLSTVASRVKGRAPDTTWSVANLIFSMNPRAFIRNDPNLIKLGWIIDIPDVSQLTGLASGLQPITAAATRPESFNEPQPTRVPTPVAVPVESPVTVSRPGTSISEPEPERSNAKIKASEPTTAATAVTNAEQPVTAQPVESDTVNSSVVDTPDVPTTDSKSPVETAAISPFLDEQPAPPISEQQVTEVSTNAVAETPVADAGLSAVTGTVETMSSDSSGLLNALLAILVGMVLGLGASLVIFRRQLAQSINGLKRRKIFAPVRRFGKAYTGTSMRAAVSGGGEDTAESFETKEAEAAFVTSHAVAAFESQQNGPEPLPIKEAMESTYIVETGVADTTMQDFDKESDPGTAEDPNAAPIDPDEEILAQLFDEDSSMPDHSSNEIFDPSGGIESSQNSAMDEPYDPTLYALGNEPGSDSTVEMPVGSPTNSSEETVEMPVDSDAPLNSALVKSLDGTLDNIDPEEAFSTSNNLSEVSEVDRDPVDNALESTISDDFAALPSENDDGMTRTLMDAMTMLEEEFDDEFTASQILERSEINRHLKSRENAEPENTEPENAENTDPVEQKING